MADQNLFELLNLSIDSPAGGVVNFTTLRVLLDAMLKRICADEEKSSTRTEQHKVALEQLSSLTATSDTKVDHESDHAVTKCMCQDLLKENQELKEETSSLGKEVDKLQNQLSQCLTWEDLQAALKMERQMTMTNLKDSATDPFTDQTPSQVGTGVHDHPETLKDLTDADQLQENLSESSGLNEKHDNLAANQSRDNIGGSEQQSYLHLASNQSRDNIGGSEQQSYLKTSDDIRNAVQKLEEEVQKMKEELKAFRMEQNNKEMQDKTMLDKMMASSSSTLSWSLQQEHQVSPASPSGHEGVTGPAWLPGMMDLSTKTSLLSQTAENLQSIVTGHTKQDTSDGTFQSTDLDLYKTVKELDENKADKKKFVKFAKSIKADMQSLEAKFLLSETKAEQQNRVVQDLQINVQDQEEYYQKAMEKILSKLDSKVNYVELEPLKNRIEDIQMRIPKQEDGEPVPEYDDAAGLKRKLKTRFNCLSCDHPVNMVTPGPPLLTLPRPPSLPSKPNRRLKPCTVLGLAETSTTSTTERSKKQTAKENVRDRDSCKLNVNKKSKGTSDAKIVNSRPITCPKEGIRKTKDTAIHSPPVTSSAKTPGRMLPLRPLRYKPELIYAGVNRAEKVKQWLPEDSTPKVRLTRQHVSSMPLAKKP